MEITNPIIPGFAPDPSVVLVDDTYYLVTSSFHVFPGLPIYTSRDLRDWTLRGHAISRTTQLSLKNAWTSYIPVPDTPNLIITGGLFAPTIRFHDSTFYIVCTNAIEDANTKEHRFENFFVSCPKAQIFEEAAWSDPICFEFPGIDPSLFFDPETGRAYIQGSYRKGPPWAPDCSIRQFEVDISSGKALSEIKLLWEGANSKRDAEGPHMYLKDGWYYLVTAEGSTFEGHEINIARSRDIWGPYESCPSNPLLTAHGSEEDVQWTGHGDLFQDNCGGWWCVHLGVRQQNGKILRCPLGRETFLTSVIWECDSWPKIKQTKMQCSVLADALPEQDIVEVGHGSSVEDLHIRTPELSDYQRVGRDSYRLHPRTATLSAATGSTTFIGRRQRLLQCSAIVRLKMETISIRGLQAGLAVYKDSLRHAGNFYDSTSHEIVFQLASIEDKNDNLPKCQVPSSARSDIMFKIEATSDSFIFSWSTHESGTEPTIWHQIAAIDAATMSGHDMTGTIFGLFANTIEGSVEMHEWVHFEHFEVVESV